MRSAPALSASAPRSPKRGKSAERMEGASLTMLFIYLLLAIAHHSLRPSVLSHKFAEKPPRASTTNLPFPSLPKRGLGPPLKKGDLGGFQLSLQALTSSNLWDTTRAGSLQVLDASKIL